MMRFLKSFTPSLKVEEQNSHQEALTAVDHLWGLASEDELDHYGSLLLLLANIIERYESLDPDLNNFIERSKAISADIAMLTALMNQNGLSERSS